MKIYRELIELMDRGQPAALAVLVSTAGSSPQSTGAKVLFLPDGRIIGTIGGGCMEVEARRVALDCLRSGEPRLFELSLDDDFGWDDGLICGGRVQIFINPNPAESRSAFEAAIQSSARREKGALCTVVGGDGRAGETAFVSEAGALIGGEWVEGLRDAAAESVQSARERVVQTGESTSVYVEPVLPRPTLLIAGAGHVGTALAEVASLCGFEVVVVDDRPAFANGQRLPFADRVAVERIPEFVRDYPVDDQTYIAIVTRGHRNDAQVLRECIGSPARYIGMIGSKRKIVVIFEELLREGLATPEQLRRVRSPMGLTLGDVEVGEIAVSIMAEITAIRRGADESAIRPMHYTPPSLRQPAEGEA